MSNTESDQGMLVIAEKNPPVSQAKYARMKGVSKVRIGRLVADGIISLDAAGKIDPELADKQIENVMPEGIGNKKRKTSKTSSFTEAKISEKRIQVSLLELNYQEKAGLLVKTKDVEAAAFTEARKLRDNMLNIPDRISALVAAEHDENIVRQIITDEIEKGLQSK